jgi:GNAT superfamily N-acetyltransferase
MTIAVRRATASDAELVSALNADVQAVHAAALPWRFKSPGQDTFPPSEAAALIANPNNHAFIAEIAAEPAGYAYAEVIRRGETSFHYAYEMVYLHHISVRPEHRRRGVGQALLAAVRAAAKELGITFLAADVWSFNDGARSFFQRHGFKSYNERLWDR